jgi:cell division protein FtsB
MLGLGLIGLLFAFVYPTSTYLHQRDQRSAGEAQIAKLDAQTKELERQNAALRGDAAVEQIAREEYGLVRPGETPYVIVPSTPTTTPVKTTVTTAVGAKLP